MSNAEQTVFARAVTYHLPNAIPTHLERIDEFAIGKVLVYSKRPHRLMPWRRRELDFTGYSLSTLLDESASQKLELNTSSSFMFDVGTGTSTLDLTVDVELDGDLKKALKVLNLGGDVDIKSDYEKKISITADFGKITHVTASDLLSSCSSPECALKVNTDHPIVQRAMEHGGTLFVILAMYMAERCNISVDVSKSEKEEGKAEVDAGDVAGDEDVSDSKTSKKVANRDVATPIAFLCLRTVIKSDGRLQAQLNNKLSGHHVTKEQGQYELSHFVPFHQQGLDTLKLVTSHEVDDWVVINFEQQEEEASESGIPTPPAAAVVEGDNESSGVESSPEHRAMVQSDAVLEHREMVQPEAVAVKVESNLTFAVPELKTPFITPLSEVPTAKLDQTDAPALDQHYVYSLKDFQAFDSSTYQGIIVEVDQWVVPVTASKKLHSAYLNYLKLPKMLEKLQKLSDFLQQYGDAQRMHKDLPTSPDQDVGALLAAMDSDWAHQIDQVTSLIIITEAALEFPQHIVKGALALPVDKRKTLADLIKSTPYGTDKHVYLTEGPIKDADLFPIMTRMGFSLPAASTHLIYTAPDDEDDILAAGLILLKATAPDP